MIRDPEFLTVSQAAALFRVSGYTVRRWISEGRIDAKRLGPKSTRIPAAEVRRLMRTQAAPLPDSAVHRPLETAS